jgi:hypothetical protein
MVTFPAHAFSGDFHAVLRAGPTVASGLPRLVIVIVPPRSPTSSKLVDASYIEQIVTVVRSLPYSFGETRFEVVRFSQSATRVAVEKGHAMFVAG